MRANEEIWLLWSQAKLPIRPFAVDDGVRSKIRAPSEPDIKRSAMEVIEKFLKVLKLKKNFY